MKSRCASSKSALSLNGSVSRSFWLAALVASVAPLTVLSVSHRSPPPDDPPESLSQPASSRSAEADTGDSQAPSSLRRGNCARTSLFSPALCDFELGSMRKIMPPTRPYLHANHRNDPIHRSRFGHFRESVRAQGKQISRCWKRVRRAAWRSDGHVDRTICLGDRVGPQGPDCGPVEHRSVGDVEAGTVALAHERRAGQQSRRQADTCHRRSCTGRRRRRALPSTRATDTRRLRSAR